MSLPRPIAWLILGLGFFTAGLLRHYHDQIFASPWVHPVVGSLHFAAILLLLLVAARERRMGALRDAGVRVGSLTPILLMLLVEKWLSISFYGPSFGLFPTDGLSDADLDARFRAFAGVALILTCLLLATFSEPAALRTWRRARPIRWLPAAAGTATVVVIAYVVLGGLTAILGGGLHLVWPVPDRLWAWVVAGQAVRAFAEELYYRGLLLSEMERLAPRLGVRGPAGRRWLALLPPAFLFSLEHMAAAPQWEGAYREALFTFALGLLFGILVLITNNLHFAAGIHAFINWLLLGAAPRFADASGQSTLSPGTYVGLILILAFILSFLTQKAEPDERAFVTEGAS